PLRALRYPVKAMMAASLCWALLGGAGLDAWHAPGPVPPRRWIGLSVAPAFVLALAAAVGAWALGRWPEVIASVVLRPGTPSPMDALHPARQALVIAAAIGAAASSIALWRLRAAAPLSAVAASVLAAADLLAAHALLVPTAP